MKIAEKSFSGERRRVPRRIVRHHRTRSSMADGAARRSKSSASPPSRSPPLPTVPMHDADVPRIAIYSSWSNTQELGWYRFTFDKFGIPYDLIFKEQVKQGNLRAKYDVIIMAAQQLGRAQVLQRRRRRARCRTEDGQVSSSSGCTARRRTSPAASARRASTEFAKFLEGGGTLIAAGHGRAASRPSSASRTRSTRRIARRRASTRRGRSSRREIVRPESSGLLRLRGQDAAGEIPRRPVAHASALPTRATCSRATSAATARC